MLVHTAWLQATPGDRVSITIEIFATAHGGEPLWAEHHPSVEVGPLGRTVLLLGAIRPLPSTLFDRYPRWLAARLGDAEVGPREPVLGDALRLARRLDQAQGHRPVAAPSGLEGRIARAESHLRRLRDGFDHLHLQVQALAADPWRDTLRADLAELGARLDALASHRLQRIEDEIEDLVGPDGDVVDLDARLDALDKAISALLPTLRQLTVDPDPAPNGD